jgi:hypothetical protein
MAKAIYSKNCGAIPARRNAICSRNPPEIATTVDEFSSRIVGFSKCITMGKIFT